MNEADNLEGTDSKLVYAHSANKMGTVQPSDDEESKPVTPTSVTPKFTPDQQ